MLTAETRIRVKAPLPLPQNATRPALTGDTKIRLSQIADLAAFINDFKDGDVTTHADGSMWKRDAPGKWHKIKKDKYTRQAEEEYKKNPFDKNGKHFVKNSKGSIDFGFITKEQAGKMGQQPGPIRLSEGTSGYGLLHAKPHETQVQKKGYKDIPSFIEDVVNSYDEIKYLGTNPRFRKDGSEKQERCFILFRKKDVGCVLIEYERSKYGKNFYTVNTAGIFTRSNKYKNSKTVWL